MIEVGTHFWNIRGSYKVAGLLEVGTQASLVQRSGGGFLLLDTCAFDDDTSEQIDAYTDGGAAIEAILNLHPFHTLHVESVHQRYPEARLYGTRRHLERLPDLPWESLTTDDAAVHAQFAEDLAFSVPAGVDFISSNERVHFSSVLAYHAASKTLHVDDTFNYVPDRGLLHFTPLADTVSFHPTLAKALERRAGATDDFRSWATGLIERWRAMENLCAAHAGVLLQRENTGAGLQERLLAALENVSGTLAKHDERHG